MVVEVEIRSFIKKEKYDELLDFFKKNAEFEGEDDQETHYFDGKNDLRIQKNKSYSKIWLKGGRIHDEERKEVEVKFGRDDFEKLEELFLSLGYNVSIKWFRKRNSFKWEGLGVSIDYTKGYGYIIELEKLSDENDKDTALNLLKEKMRILNVDITPKELFDKKFEYYRENWEKLALEK
ncbi:CYTH domain protein [Candidatus Tiddalikarchaeum anstoanum]|nr:CYTH domain protein [Candidatus Tiddalikarchaeum anstoanum]